MTRNVPRVTIVMTARERHGLTVPAIESIVRNTTIPFRFIYSGSRTPAPLQEALARGAEGWGLELIEWGEPLWPNQIRKRIAPALTTDYVVFVDNDVSVAPGWLEHLVACADQTGAGIVCPLYLIGADGASTRIHMAGGRLERVPAAGGISLRESHLLLDQDLAAAAPELRRSECDFAEYHCVLIRTRFAQDGSIFDERIVCVHEHIDTALSVQTKGGKIFIEPAARVTYLGTAPLQPSDRAFYRERWAADAVEASLQAFRAKWGVVDDEASFGDVRSWARAHRAKADPVPAPASIQTFEGLKALARSRGYDASDWELVEQAYGQAHAAFEGKRRVCGRPFIDHLVGTAGVLLQYDLKPSVVAAGLLHASQAPRAWNKALNSPMRVSDLPLEDVERLAIAAANEAEIYLSGEHAKSGRADMAAGEELERMACACERLGAAGLAETLRRRTPRTEAPSKSYKFENDYFSHGLPSFQRHLSKLKGLPCSFLQIGASEGRSSVWMLDHLLTHPEATLTEVELRPRDVYWENIRAAGAERKVRFLCGPSRKLLRTLPLDGFDFVYVDGCHSTIEVLEDAVLSFALVKPGGVLAFDDYGWDDPRFNQSGTPKKAIDAFLQVYGPRLDVLEHGYQVWVRRRS